MAVEAPKNPPVHWDRAGFDELEATWSPKRRRKDAETLANVFALAADAPLMAEALKWAQDHGLKFFVDHKSKDMGYYVPGTGVLGITEVALKDPSEAVGTIVHEIRHAWQEYRNLSADAPPGFAEAYIKNALTEADAEAFGMRAQDQYEASQMKKEGLALPTELQASLANETADLGGKFLYWFWGDNDYAYSYGNDQSKDIGQDYGVYKRVLRGGQHEEFSPDAEPAGGNIEIGNIQDVLCLGATFSGRANYLAHLQRDILPRDILSPALADTFWGTASKRQMKRVRKIRKAGIKEKLSQPKKRHPWP